MYHITFTIMQKNVYITRALALLDAVQSCAEQIVAVVMNYVIKKGLKQNDISTVVQFVFRRVLKTQWFLEPDF